MHRCSPPSLLPLFKGDTHEEWLQIVFFGGLGTVPQGAGFRPAAPQIKGFENGDLVAGWRHRAEWEQIVFFEALEWYHSLPDSVELSYKSRELKTAIRWQVSGIGRAPASEW